MGIIHGYFIKLIGNISEYCYNISIECKSWIGIPIKGEVNPDDEVKIENMPAMEVAVTKFKGPSSELKNTYKKIGEWMDENGYTWNGPCLEVCTKKPKEINGEMILFTTIQVPIKKK